MSNNRNNNRPAKLTFWQKILKAIGLYKEPKSRRISNNSPKSSTQSSSNRNTNNRGGNTGRKRNTGGGPRNAEPVPVKTPRLYVGNLSYDATESDIEELFKGIGTVKSVEIIYNRHTHKSKGYGFVQMLSVDEAKRAVDVLHDQPFMGRQLIVNGSKSRKESDPKKHRDQVERKPITEEV